MSIKPKKSSVSEEGFTAKARGFGRSLAFKKGLL